MQINILAQEDPKKCINRVKNSLLALPSAFITRNDEFSLYQEIKNNNRVLINNWWFFRLLLSFFKGCFDRWDCDSDDISKNAYSRSSLKICILKRHSLGLWRHVIQIILSIRLCDQSLATLAFLWKNLSYFDFIRIWPYKNIFWGVVLVQVN